MRANGSFELTNAGYDTDIYYGFTATPVPDYSASAGARIQLLIPLSKTIIVDLFEFPQYMFYLSTERERTLNNRFRGQVHIALERLYFQAGGGISDVRNRLSPELDLNIRERSNRFDGLVLWQASRRVSIAALYGRTEHDFGEASYEGQDIARALNRVEDIFDLNLYIQLPGSAR